jgi:peptidoglycan/xylan/chitin deacetylase (PgdA/CDA1 family)
MPGAAVPLPSAGGAALALTFDLDAEAAWLAAGGHEHRLSTRSEARYGLGRGLQRVLDLLARHGAPATFYVPGATAVRHPDAVRRILDAGHEVGHHGHDHRRTHEIGPADERAELERGLEALAGLGVTPRGYRSPAWELTPHTLELLGELGFGWDSSLMEDDRPYTIAAGSRRLLELPVHWTLDDRPALGRTALAGGDPERLGAAWGVELESAAAEQRPLTVTAHPEVVGRPARLAAVDVVLEAAARLGVPALTHAAVAARLG